MCTSWERGPFCAEPLKPPASHFDSLLFLGRFCHRNAEGKILPGPSFLETSSGLSTPLRAAGVGSVGPAHGRGKPELLGHPVTMSESCHPDSVLTPNSQKNQFSGQAS